MRTKIVQTLLFSMIALLFFFSGSELPGSFEEHRMGRQGHTPQLHRAAAPSGWAVGISNAYASEKRFEDYWDEQDEERVGYFNIFLKTGNPYVKAGAFTAFMMILYLASWAIFRSFIMRYRSPQKTFVYSFLGFLLFVYASAFLCFSEYAMIQAYDEKELYLFQLNWMIVGVSFAIWAIFSLLLTYIMKGKA